MDIGQPTHFPNSPVHRRVQWLIVGAHLVLLAILYSYQGILMDKEALKYVGCAEAVLHGDFTDLTGNYLKYAGYVLFLLPFVAIGSPVLAIPAQVVIGILAARALARLTTRITGSGALGQVAMAAMLWCPLIQVWALALYTEHLFVSLTVLFLDRLEHTPSLGPGVVRSAVLTLFTRPVGICTVAPALLWKWLRNGPLACRTGWLVIACGAVILAVLLGPRIARPQLLPIATGQVIAGVSGTEGDGFQGRTILQAQLFLVEQVGFAGWTGITMRRIVSLFTLTRPYFSSAHNAANALFYSLYPFALVGLWRLKHDDRTALLIAVVLVNAVLVGLTHDEWSGRFVVPVLPPLIVLACCAFARR